MLITLLKISRNVVAWNFEMEKIGVKKCITRRDLYGFDIEPNVRSNIKASFTINKTKAYVDSEFTPMVKQTYMWIA